METEEDYDFDPEATVIFKPNAMQRMVCKPVGELIDCKNTDCEICDYKKCSVKKQIAEREKRKEDRKKERKQ
jgi:hypothetical protein